MTYTDFPFPTEIIFFCIGNPEVSYSDEAPLYKGHRTDTFVRKLRVGEEPEQLRGGGARFVRGFPLLAERSYLAARVGGAWRKPPPPATVWRQPWRPLNSEQSVPRWGRRRRCRPWRERRFFFCSWSCRFGARFQTVSSGG